jgi:hypothetical protein
MAKIKFIINPLNGELVPVEEAAAAVTWGNIDGGTPTSTYGAVSPIDCGGVT